MIFKKKKKAFMDSRIEYFNNQEIDMKKVIKIEKLYEFMSEYGTSRDIFIRDKKDLKPSGRYQFIIRFYYDNNHWIDVKYGIYIYDSGRFTISKWESDYNRAIDILNSINKIVEPFNYYKDLEEKGDIVDIKYNTDSYEMTVFYKNGYPEWKRLYSKVRVDWVTTPRLLIQHFPFDFVKKPKYTSEWIDENQEEFDNLHWWEWSDIYLQYNWKIKFESKE